MKDYNLFVGVTIVPLWKNPPKTAIEVRSRADLKEAFLKTSAQFAEQLKQMIESVPGNTLAMSIVREMADDLVRVEKNADAR